MEEGGSLGVRWHKNTTGSVDSRGRSGAFLSSPQSCPLLLCLSLIQPVCLPLLSLSLSVSPSHKAALVRRRAHCTETLFMRRKPPLHTGRLFALILRSADTMMPCVTSGSDSHNIFGLLKIVVAELSPETLQKAY